jgi:phosphoglycolate phosphatase
MRYKAVFFDLDGTLVDTLDDLTDAMNYALSQLGQPGIGRDACREMIGKGLAVFADKALPEGAKHLQQALIDAMKARYVRTCLDKTRIYAGMAGLVSQCRQKGLKLGVVSNKSHPLTVKIAEHYFGSEVFGIILGQKEDVKIKPDPEPIQIAMKAVGVDLPQETLYVGDSDVDVETARNAGTDFVAVGWGFRSEQQLRQAGAEKIIYNAGDLLNLILAS